MPTRTSLLRSVTTSTPVTRRCTSLRPRINENSPSRSSRGADVRARNRRGAEPLHYAADGGPDAEHWDPVAQREVIAYLIAAGADPNALDKSGVAPLHRAVRNRCSAAASALIDNGADPLLMNKSGSTPLHLAVQNTGKSNSGSEASKDEQGRVIALLLRHGASPTDVDANGKTVAARAVVIEHLACARRPRRSMCRCTPKRRRIRGWSRRGFECLQVRKALPSSCGECSSRRRSSQATEGGAQDIDE